MSEKKQRLRYIDIAKGIGMVSIVLGHLGETDINRFVFTYHLPIFYFIAGYFLTVKNSNLEFIKKRIRTLLLPYYFTCLLIVLMMVVKTVMMDHGVPVKQTLLDWIYASLYASGNEYQFPFYIKSIGAIWFLWALFWAEIMLRKILDLPYYFRVPAVFGIFFIGIWSRKFFWFPLSIQAGCCALLFVYTGYLARQLKRKDRYTHAGEHQAFAFFLSVCMWIWFIKNFHSFWLVYGEIGNGFAGIIGSMCACYALIRIVKWIDQYFGRISKGLAFLGRYSLLFLTYHIIELDVFPWDIFFNSVNYHFPNIVTSLLWFKILGKFIWIIGMLLLTHRWSLIKKIYGYAEIPDA